MSDYGIYICGLIIVYLNIIICQPKSRVVVCVCVCVIGVIWSIGTCLVVKWCTITLQHGFHGELIKDRCIDHHTNLDMTSSIHSKSQEITQLWNACTVCKPAYMCPLLLDVCGVLC